MKNGHDNQPIQISPQQAATYALQFLDQVPHTRTQREAYDIAVSLLQAIATGQVIIAPSAANATAPVQEEAPH
ncbi:MAG TPA: hypothetical protein VFB63_19470 [Bryobacteraceae bacterium]|nr:hypothetical protein [Bryobacteraceae bacterium]